MMPTEKAELNIERIFNSPDLTPKQKEILKKYQVFKTGSQGISIITMMGYLMTLKDLGRFIRKPYDKITEEDIHKYLAEQNKKNKQNTVQHKMVSIAEFYKNYMKQPEKVQSFKIKRPKIIKQSKDMISKEEIKLMLDACDNARDKALISLLYDTNFRIGTFIRLSIGDVQKDEYGMIVSSEGKTGLTEDQRILESSPYLLEWLNLHPYKEDNKAPLFITISTNRYGQRINDHAINQLLKKISKRAGIQKNVTAHILRASRLTHLAQDGFTEMELRKRANWSQTSEMAAFYVRIGNRDLDKKLLAKYGLLDGDEMNRMKEKERILKPRTCVNSCKEIVDNKERVVIYGASDKFCRVCGKPLSLKIAHEFEEARKLGDVVVGRSLETKGKIDRDSLKEIIKEMVISGEIEL